MGKGRPTGGYDFQAKKSYRRKLWDFIDEQLGEHKRQSRVVAVLDTQEGLEVRELLRRGYDPENIFAINNGHPAILATMTRKLDEDGLPRVQTKGMSRDYLEALEEVTQRTGGRVDVANFDACAALGWGETQHAREHVNGATTDARTVWGGYLHHVARLVRSGGVVGHTMLIGRERGPFREIVRGFQDKFVTDRGRVVPATYLRRLTLALGYVSTCYQDSCHLHVSDLAYDWYTSASGQRMLWFGARLQSHASFPLSLDQWMALARRKYRARGDRMLCLMLPRCMTTAIRALEGEEEPCLWDDNMLAHEGSMRFRHCRMKNAGDGRRGGDASSTEAVDDFTPWATDFNGPMRT